MDKLRGQCDFLSEERTKLAEENKRLKASNKVYKDEMAILKELLVNSKAEITILKSEVKDYKASEMAAFANYHKYAAAIKELDSARPSRKPADNKSTVSARESNDPADLSAYINLDNRSKSIKADSNRPLAKPYLHIGHSNPGMQKNRPSNPPHLPNNRSFTHESTDSRPDPIVLPAMGRQPSKEFSQSTAPDDRKGGAKKRMMFRQKVNTQDKRLYDDGRNLSLNLSLNN